MTQSTAGYDVGGVILPRPFKIRRLGHIGFNVDDVAGAIAFYTDVLGFQMSDMIDMASRPGVEQMADQLNDTRVAFMSYCTDHHSLILYDKVLGSILGDDALDPEIRTSQVTWQLGSLEEVVDAAAYLEAHDVEVLRTGRDMPGSNWHVYFRDPDGHTVELYYGMEQLGWDRGSKPLPLYSGRYREPPVLPHISETAEVAAALANGVDLGAGFRPTATVPDTYAVGGVLLPRPFKITRLGPVALYVKDLERSVRHYTDVLGFTTTEEVEIGGCRCVFLRVGTEHHSLALLPVELRPQVTPAFSSTCMALGLEVATYAQLRDAVGFLLDHGCLQLDSVEARLHPGIDYAAYLTTPSGQNLELYYYMENVGWDGRPRPHDQRRAVREPWPATLEPLSDTYADQTFQGPWG
jgi:catechol 2,3-dioxygenase-like lactoylglutathione lyase family enzyme